MALFSSFDSLSLNRMDQGRHDLLGRGPAGLLLRTTQSTFLTILALVESKHKALSGTYDSIVKVAVLAASKPLRHLESCRAIFGLRG
jgi:hypothetical protein